MSCAAYMFILLGMQAMLDAHDTLIVSASEDCRNPAQNNGKMLYGAIGSNSTTCRVYSEFRGLAALSTLEHYTSF